MYIFTMEIWKSIENTNDKYFVSNYGNIKNRKGHILSNWKSEKGYSRVSLYIDGAQKNCFVHRLVAEAFIPNPDNKPYVDHISGVKSDNSETNLRWVTNSENILNPNTHQRFYKRMWS